jgi:hypothetical protein
VTNAAINIQNELTTAQSLDIKLSEDRVIRSTLAAKGAIGGGDVIDVGDVTTLDELNANTEFRKLLDASPVKVSMSVVGGTNDVAGSDAATAVANSEGLGGSERFSAAVPVGGGGAEDQILIASMPYAALVLDAQILVTTTEATTWTLRDAIAGGGNALSDDLSTAAAGRVRDASSDLAGVVPTIAKGAPLVLRKAASATAVGTVLVELQRLS